jgi:hypothetical protein
MHFVEKDLSIVHDYPNELERTKYLILNHSQFLQVELEKLYTDIESIWLEVINLALGFDQDLIDPKELDKSLPMNIQ